jgi:hypothetical protein
MMTTAYVCDSVIMHHSLPCNRTVRAEKYIMFFNITVPSNVTQMAIFYGCFTYYVAYQCILTVSGTFWNDEIWKNSGIYPPQNGSL